MGAPPSATCRASLYGPWATGTSFGTLRTSTARRRSHLVAEPVRRSGLFAGASRDGETRTRTGPDGVPGRGHGRLHRGRVARPGLEPGTRRFSGTGNERSEDAGCSRFADRERVLDAGGFPRFPVGLGHGRGVRGLNRHPPMSVAGWAGLPGRTRSSHRLETHMSNPAHPGRMLFVNIP